MPSRIHRRHPDAPPPKQVPSQPSPPTPTPSIIRSHKFNNLLGPTHFNSTRDFNYSYNSTQDFGHSYINDENRARVYNYTPDRDHTYNIFGFKAGDSSNCSSNECKLPALNFKGTSDLDLDVASDLNLDDSKLPGLNPKITTNQSYNNDHGWDKVYKRSMPRRESECRVFKRKTPYSHAWFKGTVTGRTFMATTQPYRDTGAEEWIDNVERRKEMDRLAALEKEVENMDEIIAATKAMDEVDEDAKVTPVDGKKVSSGGIKREDVKIE